MKEFCIGILLFFAIIFGIAWLTQRYLDSNPERYHYIATDGKEGDAPSCDTLYGVPKCEYADGRKIMVMEYWKN